MAHPLLELKVDILAPGVSASLPQDLKERHAKDHAERGSVLA